MITALAEIFGRIGQAQNRSDLIAQKGNSDANQD